jgi:hypothetical protein
MKDYWERLSWPLPSSQSQSSMAELPQSPTCGDGDLSSLNFSLKSNSEITNSPIENKSKKPVDSA